MARPRCKPHRPFYFLWGNTASRASGSVVKVAAASRANTPVRKCGVKYQVSWWEQPDIPRNARIVYDTEGRVVDMVRGSLMHAARLGAGTAAVIAVLGLSGCAFNPLSTFTTPTIDQIEYETVTPAVSDDALVTPGTLTVALDTSDAPQAMQGADGELTGYAVDAARALASRMGLKVAFVDASSAGSALGDKKADIFIGEINSTDGDISSLGTCLYDATSVFGKTSDGGSLSVSTDTLNTSTLGVQTSSASQEALAKQSITANQKTYSNINECFEALESGEVDYVICDSTAGGYLARLMSEVSYVGALEAPSTLGVAGLSSNDELCRASSVPSTVLRPTARSRRSTLSGMARCPTTSPLRRFRALTCSRSTLSPVRPRPPAASPPIPTMRPHPPRTNRPARKAPSPTTTLTNSIASYC